MIAAKSIPERRAGFVMDKTVNLANVLTMASALVVGGVFLSKMDTRVTVLENAEISRKENLVVSSAAAETQRLEIKQDLREIRQDIKALTAAVNTK